ncbi:MAG TPA: hypothetical protein DGZ24_07120 [Rhodospirillaceae bacterium]|nr:hypothetical protein [Rhodospirillaceae bacterium]
MVRSKKRYEMINLGLALKSIGPKSTFLILQIIRSWMSSLLKPNMTAVTKCIYGRRKFGDG